MNAISQGQWVNHNPVPSSRHGGYMNDVSAYSPLPFMPEHQGAGLIVRIVELYNLRNMKPLFDEFENVTGYRICEAGCSREELELLITSINKIYAYIGKRIDDVKHEISVGESKLNEINKGNASGSGANIREQAYRINDAKERLTGVLNGLEKQSDYIAALMGLLQSEVICLRRDGIESAVSLDKYQQAIYDVNYIRMGSKAGKYIINALEKLTSAINSILSSCKVPEDKFARRDPNLAIKNEASRFYYSQDGVQIRNIMSHSEYIQCISFAPNAAYEKHLFMKADYSIL